MLIPKKSGAGNDEVYSSRLCCYTLQWRKLGFLKGGGENRKFPPTSGFSPDFGHFKIIFPKCRQISYNFVALRPPFGGPKGGGFRPFAPPPEGAGGGDCPPPGFKSAPLVFLNLTPLASETAVFEENQYNFRKNLHKTSKFISN